MLTEDEYGEQYKARTVKQAEVMLAFSRGEVIQSRGRNRHPSIWTGADRPTWNWLENDYRVKPKEVTVYVNIYRSGSTASYTSKELAEQFGNGKYAIVIAHPVTVTEQPD